MRTPAIHIILILILLGCKATSDKKDIVISKITKVDSTDSIIPTQFENKYKSIKWTNTFSKNTLGFLQTGDSVSKALDL